MILGRAGMGRTRFLSELSARVRLDGGTVVRVNAMPSDARDSAPSLGHLADALLHEAPGLGATEPGAISALVASRPAWAERFPSVVPSGEVSLLDAITAAVHASAGDRPLMIAIDDAGCLHPAAREALLALCRASDHTALLVAVTGEMVEGEDSVAELARASGTALPGLVVIIAPLVAGDIALLVADALPAWPPEAQDRLVRRLVDESAGSPLIVSAILDAVRAGLLVTDAGTVWPVADRTLDASLPAAPSAAFTLAVRHAFRRLPLPEGEVLRWLAAVPGPMSEADLRVLAKELPDLASVLDSLEATGWVESDVRGYRITARAIGRCIREDAMTPGQRRRMLAQWGDRNS